MYSVFQWVRFEIGNWRISSPWKPKEQILLPSLFLPSLLQGRRTSHLSQLSHTPSHHWEWESTPWMVQVLHCIDKWGVEKEGGSGMKLVDVWCQRPWFTGWQLGRVTSGRNLLKASSPNSLFYRWGIESQSHELGRSQWTTSLWNIQLKSNGQWKCSLLSALLASSVTLPKSSDK